MHTARFLALAVLALSATAAARAPEVGDVVWAEWSNQKWFHGKIDGRCDGGAFHVLFDDKDKACVKPSGLALDRVPEAEQIVAGVRVLARWDDLKFYPGKVTQIKGMRAMIAFDDGDRGEATLGDLRLISR